MTEGKWLLNLEVLNVECVVGGVASSKGQMRGRRERSILVLANIKLTHYDCSESE